MYIFFYAVSISEYAEKYRAALNIPAEDYEEIRSLFLPSAFQTTK